MAGHREIADLLIKFKPNVNALDFEGKSALMVAVINGNLHLTELLINHGADITIKNKFNKNIYDMASSMGNIVSYFLLNIFRQIFKLKRNLIKRLVKYFDQIGLIHRINHHHHHH